MTAALGYAGQIGMGTATPVTNRFEIVSENLVCAEEIINGNGLIGSRSHTVDRTRPGLRRIGGPIRMQPNAIEWSYWLQYMMGGTPSAPVSGVVTYPLADSLTAVYVAIDRISKVFTYNGCKIDKAHVRGRQGEPLELELEVVGIDETIGSGGTFPVLTLDHADGPFIFSDLVLVINSLTVTVQEFELTIDNKINKDRFFNALVLQTVETQDREITLRATLPYGDWNALYGAGSGGVAASATATNGAAALVFTLPALVFPKKSPMLPGRVESMLTIEGRAYKVQPSSLELVATLNTGP